MNEILDSNTLSNPLIDLVEYYISLKRDSKPIEATMFSSELTRLGFSPSQVADLLIEMDDDADKELLAGEGVKKAKNKLVVALIVGISGIVLTLANAVGVLPFAPFGVMIIPYGIVAAAFIVAGKAYSEIGLVDKRKKRRFLKYQDWK